MNNEEQTLIDGLFSKLKTAETTSAPRDAGAEAVIKEHLNRQPAAPYYMTQAILVQEAAVNQLNSQIKQRDEQIQQLQAELQQAKAQSSSAPASGGFLSNIFGSSAPRAPQPQAQPAATGGWRDGSGFNNPAPAQQAGYGAAPAAPVGSGFLGGALKTAAGVAGGVMLAEGISSLFSHHNQPQEIVEVIHDAPAQDQFANHDQTSNNDQSNWGQPDSQYTADDNYNDDGGMFSDDDDSFV
ncbi:DUF2076 domain-containing protein [Pseudomonas viridiflava]|uniref:Putative periplasmic ligand-binding sensor protein n=1 Tax=Pseudomonas viridiflava TaxID=33069 RepID=A0A3M5P2N5_PSEVI|nr:DUF2076 domain-containing protein [Pseudomonas viridiflava]MBA1229891.1 DUF2076 domain-containing protein [Pseudomonas viridiflava]RMT78206.1 putative periplasmic ligand-binding sensor protein [Pseudomonas viridiflava]